MVNQKLIQEYLAKANEAEAMARRISDAEPSMKASWIALSKGYRELADAERAPPPTPV